MAFRRADCSQAWPSASAQYRLFARAYSRKFASTSSSISKAAKLAVFVISLLSHGTDGGVYSRDAAMASSEKASTSVGSYD